MNVPDLETTIVREYERKLKLGRVVKNILEKNSIPLESLKKEEIEACELYKQYVEVKFVVWRPWQLQMLEYLHDPKQEKVIWVVGERGNEGKTFFQDQIQARYGLEKVVKFHFGSESEDMVNYLHEFVSMKTDMFLFHTYKNDDVNMLDYGMLQNIKMGWTLSTQYGGDIHFYRKNVIIVFSNKYPNIDRRQEDKWLILKINNMMELEKCDLEWI